MRKDSSRVKLDDAEVETLLQALYERAKLNLHETEYDRIEWLQGKLQRLRQRIRYDHDAAKTRTHGEASVVG